MQLKWLTNKTVRFTVRCEQSMIRIAVVYFDMLTYAMHVQCGGQIHFPEKSIEVFIWRTWYKFIFVKASKFLCPTQKWITPQFLGAKNMCATHLVRASSVTFHFSIWVIFCIFNPLNFGSPPYSTGWMGCLLSLKSLMRLFTTLVRPKWRSRTVWNSNNPFMNSQRFCNTFQISGLLLGILGHVMMLSWGQRWLPFSYLKIPLAHIQLQTCSRFVEHSGRLGLSD